MKNLKRVQLKKKKKDCQKILFPLAAPPTHQAKGCNTADCDPPAVTRQLCGSARSGPSWSSPCALGQAESGGSPAFWFGAAHYSEAEGKSL